MERTESETLNSTGSSNVKIASYLEQLTTKRIKKLFRSLSWCQAGETWTQERVQSSARAVPTQEITDAVVRLGNCISFVHEWSTKHGHHLHCLDGHWPSWLVNRLTLHSFPSQTFYYLSYQKKPKKTPTNQKPPPPQKTPHRKRSFITAPWTKILQIRCKVFIIFNIQMIPPLNNFS